MSRIKTKSPRNVGGMERAARALIGGALVIDSALSEGWRRWLFMGVGTALLRSAITQRCPVNTVLGRDSYHDAPDSRRSAAWIDKSSEDSFPASDAPSWTAGRPA